MNDKYRFIEITFIGFVKDVQDKINSTIFTKDNRVFIGTDAYYTNKSKKTLNKELKKKSSEYKTKIKFRVKMDKMMSDTQIEHLLNRDKSITVKVIMLNITEEI